METCPARAGAEAVFLPGIPWQVIPGVADSLMEPITFLTESDWKIRETLVKK